MWLVNLDIILVHLLLSLGMKSLDRLLSLELFWSYTGRTKEVYTGINGVYYANMD